MRVQATGAWHWWGWAFPKDLPWARLRPAPSLCLSLWSVSRDTSARPAGSLALGGPGEYLAELRCGLRPRPEPGLGTLVSMAC